MMGSDDFERLIRSPWIAGGFGALVGLRGAPGATWLERVFNVGCGSVIAGFSTPAVAEYFTVTTPTMQGAVSFALGLFGMNIVAQVTAWIKVLNLSDVIPWLKRSDHRGNKE